MAYHHSEHAVLIGNGEGRIMEIDLRKDGVVKSFKGVGGAIRCV